jgi:HEAT repeat protein
MRFSLHWPKTQQVPAPRAATEPGGPLSRVDRLASARDVDGLLAALSDPDLDLRKQAVAALGDLGDGRAVEPLLAALEDPALEAGAEAALGRLGAPAVEPLVRLIHEKGKTTRASGALRRIDDQRAVEPLLTALADEDTAVRAGAACALGLTGSRDAVAALCETLEDPDPLVAVWSAEALARIGDQRAVAPLVNRLKTHVSDAAAKALDDLGWTPADDAERTVHLLAKQRYHEIAPIGEGAVGPLLAFLASSGEATSWAGVNTRKRVAGVLGEISDARAVEPLIRLLQEAVSLHQTELSSAAVAALGKLGPPAVEPLIAVVVDPGENRYARGYAAQALGAIGDPRAVEPLRGILESGEDVPYVEGVLDQLDVATRPADVVLSRRGLRPANVAAYVVMDVGDLTHTMPQRTYELARDWARRDTPGPLQEDEVREVTDFANREAASTLARSGYEVVWQLGGYDIVTARESQD